MIGFRLSIGMMTPWWRVGRHQAFTLRGAKPTRRREKMRKVTITIIAAIALFGGMLTVHESNAGQASPAPVQDQSLLDVSGFGQALSGDNLSDLSGRQAVEIDKLEMMLSNVKMTGNQDNNTLGVGDHSILKTGWNIVSGDAFDHMNGFATVIQNSGNQVLIQNDLIVNVNTH
jgi:hypothetical protein